MCGHFFSAGYGTFSEPRVERIVRLSLGFLSKLSSPLWPNRQTWSLPTIAVDWKVKTLFPTTTLPCGSTATDPRPRTVIGRTRTQTLTRDISTPVKKVGRKRCRFEMTSPLSVWHQKRVFFGECLGSKPSKKRSNGRACRVFESRSAALELF